MTLEDITRDLTTRTGFRFHVRRAYEIDKLRFSEFFESVTEEDFAFRFFGSGHQVHADQAQALVHHDRQTDNFLALSLNGELLATATLVSDRSIKHAEVAISTRADHKGMGISYELLSFVADHARTHDILTLESCEDIRNRAAIDLEHDLGFVTVASPDDPGLVILRKELGKGDLALA